VSQTNRLDPTSLRVAIAVFVAFVVDGLDLQMLALALPSITADLHLTSVQAGALGTFTFIGMGLGGILAGWLSDRIGRVRVTWWAALTFTLCTGCIALSRTYWEVAALRFLSGFGIAAVYTIGSLLAAEFVPTNIRNTVLGILQAGWSVGYVIAALASAYILPTLGWRPLFYCAIVPGILALILLWSLPDPPSWSDTRSRQATIANQSWLRTQPRTRRTFLLWSLTSVALQFGYYGANSWLPSYLVKDLGINLQSMGWFIAGTYVMGIFSKVVAGYLADRIGRRAVWVTLCLITAAYLPFVVYAATPSNAALLLLLFGLFYGSPYAVNATYLSESFPSSVRGSAVGLAYNLGRLGSMASPIFIGMLATNYSIGLGIACLGAAYALCGLIPGLFIPEKMYDPRAVETPAVSASESRA